MILVDKDIKDLVSRGLLIAEGYDEENVGSVSYDLTIDEIISDQDTHLKAVTLEPDGVVFIKTKELLRIPENMLGAYRAEEFEDAYGIICGWSALSSGA